MYNSAEVFIAMLMCLAIGAVCGFFIGYMRRSVPLSDYIPEEEQKTVPEQEPTKTTSVHVYDPITRRPKRITK